MIGLTRPQQHQENENEPENIRKLTKNQLYTMLSETYLLPTIDSKGVNRAYLVAVYIGNVYRLPLLEYKRFEAELTPTQQKKTPLINLAYILRKLNALLVESHRRPLGFPPFVIPEETWLTKVARFVDRKNVMEFFQQELEPIGQPMHLSERVHQARRNAHRYVFNNNNLLENNRVFNSLKEISDCYRRIISRQIDIEDIANARQELERKLAEEEALLKSSLVKASTTIVAAAQADFDPDQIYMEGDEVGIQNRAQMSDITRLYVGNNIG